MSWKRAIAIFIAFLFALGLIFPLSGLAVADPADDPVVEYNEDPIPGENGGMEWLLHARGEVGIAVGSTGLNNLLLDPGYPAHGFGSIELSDLPGQAEVIKAYLFWGMCCEDGNKAITQPKMFFGGNDEVIDGEQISLKQWGEPQWYELPGDKAGRSRRLFRADVTETDAIQGIGGMGGFPYNAVYAVTTGHHNNLMSLLDGGWREYYGATLVVVYEDPGIDHADVYVSNGCLSTNYTDVSEVTYQTSPTPVLGDIRVDDNDKFYQGFSLSQGGQEDDDRCLFDPNGTPDPGDYDFGDVDMTTNGPPPLHEELHWDEHQNDLTDYVDNVGDPDLGETTNEYEFTMTNEESSGKYADYFVDWSWSWSGVRFEVDKTVDTETYVDNDGNNAISPDDVVTYTIDYENAGTSDANDATLVDDYNYDAPQEYVSVQNIVPAGTDDGDTITWDIGDLDPGDSGTVTYEAVLDNVPPGVTEIKNQATLTDDTNHSSTSGKTLLVDYRSDLEVEKAMTHVDNDGDSEVSTGDDIEYEITITNNGTRPDGEVSLVDAIPEDTTLIDGSIVNPPGSNVVSLDPVQIDDIFVDHSEGANTAVVQFSVRINDVVDAGNVITNTATVKYDMDTADGPLLPMTVESELVESGEVHSASDLTAEKTYTSTDNNGNGDLNSGDTINYEINITNSGDMVAYGVSFLDTIPANTTAVGDTACSDLGATISSDDPVDVSGIDIEPGETVTVTFSVDVNEDLARGTLVTNQGQVGYDADGPNGPQGFFPALMPTDDPATPEPDDPTVAELGEPIKAPPVRYPGSTVWYLPEGSTGGGPNGFETWVLLQNSGGDTAVAQLEFQRPDGEKLGMAAAIDPGSRTTVNVADIAPDEWSVSTKVTSTEPIICERAMYWNGREAAHDSLGLTDLSTEWYLAEGSTGAGFETWVLVQNPSDSDTANVNITYLTPEGETAGPSIALAPGTRQTFDVSEVVPDNYSVATKIESDIEIGAERAMYYNGRECAHDSIGTAAPASEWYLAEGSTGSGFETWVLVMNPGDSNAEVRLTYLTPEGEVPGPEVTLDAGTRQTFNVADRVPNNWSVSTKVESTNEVPIIAERAMYYNNRECAHDSIGVTQSNNDWYLAEGSTGADESGNFETFVLVMNPGTVTANVQLTYMTTDGQLPGPSMVLEPGTRQTVDVALTLPNVWSLSTKVESDQPIIAERAMYWNNRQAAHDSVGYTEVAAP